MNRATEIMDIYMRRYEDITLKADGQFLVEIELSDGEISAFGIMPTEEGYEVVCVLDAEYPEINEVKFPITTVAQVVSIFTDGRKILQDIRSYMSPQNEIALLRARLAELEGRA